MKAQEIINRTDLVALIESHGTQLKPYRNEYTGCCPFHQEKRPSFFVNPAKGKYQCFACGAHGNAYTFVAEYDHLEKGETIEYLKKFNNIIDDADDYSDYTPPAPIVIEKPKPKPTVDTVALNVAACQQILDYGRGAPHPYLDKKDVSNYPYLFGAGNKPLTFLNRDTQKPFEIHGPWLVAELVDIDFNTVAYQAISSDGTFKPFIGKLRDSYFVINPPIDEPTHVYICEGIATGLKIYQGDETRFVVCCLSASQLAHAVREFQYKYPTAKIRIMADNDFNLDHAKGNPGLYAALKAKEVALDKQLVEIYLPPVLDGVKTDWNDVGQKQQLTPSIIGNHLVEMRLLDSLSHLKSTANAVAMICTLSGVIPEREIKRLARVFCKKFVISTVQLNTISNHFPLFYQATVEELSRLKRIYESKRRGFSTLNIPTTVVESRFIENVEFIRSTEVPNITFLKSGLGSGKTQQIRQFIQSLPADSRILYVTPRMSLSTSVSREMGITDYQDISKVWKYSEAHNLSIVINSIYHIANETYDVVILDESEQILRQITSRLITDKKVVLTALTGILQRASTVIFADAHLSDVSVGFNQRVFKGRDIDEMMYLNHHAARKDCVMKVYQSANECFQALLDAISKNQKIYIATNTLKNSYAFEAALNSLSDSELECNSLRKIISGKRVKVINGDNSQTLENRAFMRDFDKRVQDVDILIVSPSITSGVSNFTPHFDAVFGFFKSGFNLSSPQDCAQQLARIRYKTECHVFYDNFSDTNLPTDREEILAKMDILLRDCVDKIDTSNGELRGQFNPYTQLYVDVKAMDNTLKRDARQMFFAIARHDGWQLDAVDILPIDQKILKKSRDLVKKQEVHGIMNARDLTAEEYSELSKVDNLSREDRHAVKKFKLTSFYEVNNKEELATLIQLEASENLREQVNAQVIFRTEDAQCQQYDLIRFQTSQEKWTEPHYRMVMPVKRMMQEIMQAFGQSQDNHVTANSPQIQKAVNWFVDNQPLCEALGYKFSVDGIKNSPVKILSKIAKRLGFIVASKVVRHYGVMRVYWIAGIGGEVSRAVNKQLGMKIDFISKTLMFSIQNVTHRVISNKEISTCVTLH